MQYFHVIVDISNENVDRPYTYAAPADVSLCPGQRVLVPFGKGNKPTEGFILGEAEPKADINIKTVIRPLENYPVMDESQLKLAHWIRSSYHCTMAQALRLMIPAQLRGAKVREKSVRVVTVNEGVGLKAELEKMISPTGTVRAKTQYAVLELISEWSGEGANTRTALAVSDILSLIPSARPALNKLIERGVITESERAVYRRPDFSYHVAGVDQAERPTLTPDQNAALDGILEGEGGSYLLHGVTGSGKTEVYLRAIEETLAAGKGSITLVPEISLTPQTVGRFKARFQNEVALLHSKLSSGERFDEWRRIRSGEARVVVGVRSAVFAPVKDLGLIIIDEEHEQSYSSEQAPRYNAIDIAKKRAQITGAKLVLGSATPSIDSYYKAKSGVYKLLKLPKRVKNAVLPETEIVDMRLEFLNGNNGIFSAALKNRLLECEARGEQAILFINRRGYSNFVECRACGYVFRCDSCDISLTYHKTRKRMICHYCGSNREVPAVCPECGRPYLKYTGIGTQQVEEEIKNLFPNLSCLRMDADTTSGKDAHRKLLSRFASGEARVLIGTQMIAKGLDFPDVTLVGVISADAMLNIPDYRNHERCFELLTQVSGRAGRAELPGHVVIQTNAPEHPIISLASNHDYEGFYEYAIKERIRGCNPPFSIFVRVLFCCDEREEDAAQNEAYRFTEGVYNRMLEKLKAAGASPDEIIFIYAMPAPIARIQGKLRWQMLTKILRTPHAGALIRAVYEELDAGDWRYARPVEVNPGEML